MPDNTLLLIALLSQALVISHYYPRKVLGIVRQVIGRYPPSEYGKLYPVSTREMLKAQRYYRIANLLIMLVGLALVAYSFISPREELLDWDSQTVLMFYFLLQSTPMIFVLVNPGFSLFNLARKPRTDRTRTAEFERRRLLDFVSPTMLFLAASTYLAFIVFVIVKPELWGAGYWNILYVTLLNVFFAATIVYHLFRKKPDPHQSHDDRLRQIQVGVQISVIGSIGATIFLVINVGLQNYAGGLQDVATSVYFQLIILLTLLMFRIDRIDFDVYKDSAGPGPRPARSIAPRSGAPVFVVFVSVIAFVFLFIFWHARDDYDSVDPDKQSQSHREAILGS